MKIKRIEIILVAAMFLALTPLAGCAAKPVVSPEADLAGYYGFGPMEIIKLQDAIGVPAGVIVFAVVVVALGAFAFTHYLDKKLGNEAGAEG